MEILPESRVAFFVDTACHLGFTDDVVIAVENHEIRYPENLVLGTAAPPGGTGPVPFVP